MSASPLRALRLEPTPDRRRFRRASLSVAGRILDAQGREHDCRTADLSPGGARLIASTPPRSGEAVVIYLNEIGRVAGAVTRLSYGEGVGVAFEATPHKREKLAEQLTWLLNKQRFAGEETRRAPRIPADAATLVTLDGGGEMYCEVMDFSLYGASLRTTQRRPEIGTWVRLGRQDGRVSRYLDQGFAVDFQPRPRPRAS